ncbi:mas-related G-protein coupled receptor member H-like [Carlito syrichta]|uniref:Mas-related G-protein coupled receptor member H-like n=1 Tax=Carlito syrichta TaxID=1868482 RepID=A0A3Q0DM52_CARSF|nr:mas-related G-protein coupled receptor member H-like [Carlito syrichta]
MELLTVTLSPLESTLYTRNESLIQTTWSSEQATQHPPPELKEYSSYLYFSLLVCIVGVTGNGIMMLFLIFYIKRKPFTVYILNLAIADFMVLLCTLVFHLNSILCNHHLYSEDLINYIYFLMIFGYNTGLHLLTAISVERCLSVLYPIWYQCQRPKHQSVVACTLLWALSVLVTGLENSFCLLADEPRITECRNVYIFSCTLTFFVFVPSMVFSSLILLIQVCCNLKSRQPAKLYIIIMATVILFLVFAMPMKVLCFITFYDATNSSVWRFLPYMNLLSTINCSVNPIVYFVVGSLRKNKSRRSLKEALQKVFEEKPVPVPGDRGCSERQLPREHGVLRLGRRRTKLPDGLLSPKKSQKPPKHNSYSRSVGTLLACMHWEPTG